MFISSSNDLFIGDLKHMTLKFSYLYWQTDQESVTKQVAGSYSKSSDTESSTRN